MSYPTSCGTDGNITSISTECMNDLWKAPPNNCTISLTATGNPNAFTLVGSTPGLLPFSTYGQTLSQVSYNISVAQNSDVLCCSGTYSTPSAEGNSNNKMCLVLLMKVELEQPFDMLKEYYIKHTLKSDDISGLLLQKYQFGVFPYKAFI